MILRKYISKLASGALILSSLLSVAPVSAASIDELTPEQSEVIEAANIATTSITQTGKQEITTGIDSLSSTATALSSYSLTLSRGSVLAWSDAIVDWTSNGTQITSSSGHQDSGYIFPNIVRKGGITKQSSSAASYHIYLSKTTIGAGVVTPWGDVTVYEDDFSDYIKVFKDGTGINY